MKTSIHVVFEYLTERGYANLNLDTLKNPTGRDFRDIISFLFRQVDENFQFGKNFEQEVLFVMKLFGYPFTISKTALTAVGSPHTWPHLLAALLWIVEFLKYSEEVDAIKEKSFALGLAGIEGEEGEQIFFRYTEGAYANFLSGSDDYTSFDLEFQAAFETKNNAVNEEISKIQEKLGEVEAEVKNIKDTEARVEELQKNRQNYVADVEKLKQLNEKLQEHMDALCKKQEGRVQDHNNKQREIASLSETREKLEKELAKQEVTPLEVQEMAHQRSMLKETLFSLQDQKENAKKEIWDLEMKISKKQSSLEKNVKLYNELALAVELTPVTAKNSGGVNFELSLTTHKKTAAEMVNVDLTQTLKPALLQLGEHVSVSFKNESARLRQNQIEHDHASDKKLEHDERVKALQKQLDKVNEDIRMEKQAFQKELNQRVGSAQSVESQIQSLNAKQRQAVDQSDGDLKQINSAIAQLMNMQAEEKRRMEKEIEEACEKVLHHKMQVSGILKTLAQGLEEHRLSLQAH